MSQNNKQARRQTLTKLVLGHLIDPPFIGQRHIHISRRGEFSPLIASDLREDFPSERLMATVALALDGPAYDSCRIRDLDDHTVDVTLGDLAPCYGGET